MIIRTKSGELPENGLPCPFSGLEFLQCKNSRSIIPAASRGEPSPLRGLVEYTLPPPVLLEYLGITKKSAGVQKITENVELIASVPFRLAADGQTEQGFPWTLSTFDLDRFGERVDPMGWDFRRYLHNPVVEWAHRYDIPAIGKIEGLTVDENGLHGSVVFNDKSFDPFGWAIGERVRAGVIRAGSVGFRVLEIEIPAAKDSTDGTTLIFRKQELLEFSICNVPANPFALVKPLALAKNIEAVKTETTQELSLPVYWGGLIHMRN